MVKWTRQAADALETAIDFVQKKYPKSWVDSLKKTVLELEDIINKGEVFAKRKGRVAGTYEIDLTPLPFFIPIRISANGDVEFLDFLHKSQRYP